MLFLFEKWTSSGKVICPPEKQTERGLLLEGGGTFIGINMIHQFNYMYFGYQINLPSKHSGH